jgi:CBS domain-containing protein
MPLVKDLMKTSVVMSDPKRSVSEAAKLMQQKDVSCVVVAVDEQIVGILTERDIVRKIVAEGFKPDVVLVENIMSTPVITISSEATIEEASKLMATFGIRRLPVVDDGRLRGIITATDIAASLAREQKYSDMRLNAIARVPKDQLPPAYG